MIAGQSYQFFSTVDPADWPAATYASAGVSAENGNEFLLRMGFFAGAKVIVMGVDVCPYCQYIEFDEDWSKSFATPFGAGQHFPIDPMTVELKRWDYGIVALGLGLTIDPQIGSSKITGIANGREIWHTAPGTPVPVPVDACIVDGSHQTKVEVNQHQYWFNPFVLALGAYLDLQVFGYGAWYQDFGIVDLDLGALGSLGLYLGGHQQCDWAFNCEPVPPGQKVAVSSSVSDQSAPTTTIALSGTPGAHGWFVSNVDAVLTAVDNPPGCGIGVATTRFGIEPAGLAPGSTFTLGSEGVATVHFASADSDGNAEALQTTVVSIDKTPPVISGKATTDPNGYGWYRSDVTVHFTASDAVSGVESVTPDQLLSAEAANQSATGTAVDHAGLSSSVVVSGINIDKTPPAVSIVGPQATGYANTTTLTLEWGATDALSGIASTSGTWTVRRSAAATPSSSSCSAAGTMKSGCLPRIAPRTSVPLR